VFAEHWCLSAGLGQGAERARRGLGAENARPSERDLPQTRHRRTETFFKINADSSIDGTHFQENGARVMARFVADGIGEAKLGLSAYRNP